MWSWLRIVLRLVAIIAVAGAAYLTVYQPKATVLGADLLTKVDLGVQCSSVYDQWTHHAQPATLALNGTPLAQVPPAQSACQSASKKIKEIGGGLVGGAVVVFVLTFVRRPGRRATRRPAGV